eukprot:2794453-Amphidinium_carterae.1
MTMTMTMMTMMMMMMMMMRMMRMSVSQWPAGWTMLRLPVCPPGPWPPGQSAWPVPQTCRPGQRETLP